MLKLYVIQAVFITIKKKIYYLFEVRMVIILDENKIVKI